MQLGKLAKRFFVAVGIIILLFLAIALTVPLFFKDKILALVKNELNSRLNANAGFKDVDISLLHSFPRISLVIRDLYITGKDSFTKDTLISASEIEINLDLLKALNGTYDINYVGLVNPRIHALVNAERKANWNIVLPTPASPSSLPGGNQVTPRPFALKLDKYEIVNGFIEYVDERSPLQIIANNLNHNGNGNFTNENFTLVTQTNIEALNIKTGDFTVLNEVKTSIDLDLEINGKNKKYSFNTDKIKLNALQLAVNGFIQLADSGKRVVDIKFLTPSNDFKNILSLVPEIYKNNFNEIKTSGKLSLGGYFKGIFYKNQIPAFGLNLAISNGEVQLPSHKNQVSDIQLKVSVINPDGFLDHTVANIEKCHILFAGTPVDLHLFLKTPVSAPWIDAAASGNVDLGQLQKFLLPGNDIKLNGTVNVDMKIKGPVSAIKKREYEKTDVSGTLNVSGLSYVSPTYPEGIQLNSMSITFNSANIVVNNMNGCYLQTHFAGKGNMDNFLGYYLKGEPLNGLFHFNADSVDVNQFIKPSFKKPDAVSSKQTAFNNPATSVSPFLVPANLNIELQTKIGYLKYDSLILTNFQSEISLKNEVIHLSNVSGAGLGGNFKMDGYYSTRSDKKNPDIAFKYTIENVDVQQTYSTFSTARKMMPAGKYISGKVTSHLVMTGKLGPDMGPVMNSLTGRGDMLLMNCVLSHLPVTDMLADELQLPQLKSFPVKDTKINFSFENGRVFLQPYKIRVGDIDGEISGSHGFDNTIDYMVNLTIPKSILGLRGNELLVNLAAQASAKGWPVRIGDKVNLAVKVTGTTASPHLETNLKNIAGNAINSLKEDAKKEAVRRLDIVKTRVNDTLKSLQNQLLNNAKDELRRKLNGGKDSGSNPQNAGDIIKNSIKGLFKKGK